MGYNSENIAEALHVPVRWLAFDIETCPMPECQQYLTEPIEAPSNYKDPFKIAAYIEEKRRTQIEKAALDLDLCEIVAIGWQDADEAGQVLTREHFSERALLTHFWQAAWDVRPLLGFNCLHFDLPVLLRRSLYLNVHAPKLQIDKYRHDGVIDVADVLTYNGRMPWRSLGFYAKRFGLAYDDRVDGERISQLVAEQRWSEIAEHCMGDVTTTTALAQRIGCVPSPVTVSA